MEEYDSQRVYKEQHDLPFSRRQTTRVQDTQACCFVPAALTLIRWP